MATVLVVLEVEEVAVLVVLEVGTAVSLGLSSAGQS